jgi:hypothetical protein
MLRQSVVLALTLAFVGCHSEMPFELVPISGKVTYDDGGLIEAGSIVITFNPVDAPTEGGLTPPGAQAEVNVQDGAFAGATTRRPGDGVLVGRHKVVVLSYDPRADGRPVASKAVPDKYRKVDSTPLTVEILEANQFVEIKIARR